MIVSEKWDNGRGLELERRKGGQYRRRRGKEQIALRVFDKTSSNPIILY